MNPRNGLDEVLRIYEALSETLGNRNMALLAGIEAVRTLRDLPGSEDYETVLGASLEMVEYHDGFLARLFPDSSYGALLQESARNALMDFTLAYNALVDTESN